MNIVKILGVKNKFEENVTDERLVELMELYGEPTIGELKRANKTYTSYTFMGGI